MVSDDVKCMKDIVLKQGSSIINGQSDVCQEFNIFFNQVADSMGQQPREILNYHNDNDVGNYVEDVIRKYSSHQSITKIKETVDILSCFIKFPLCMSEHVLKG